MPGNHALSPVLRYLHGISCQTEYFWLLPHSKCLDKFARFPFTNKIELIIKPVLRQGLYAMSSCLSVLLSPLRTCRALAWLAQKCIKAGICEWPERFWASKARTGIQFAVGAYRIGLLGRSFHLSDVIAVVYWRCI